jgi:hypothetical protein
MTRERWTRFIRAAAMAGLTLAWLGVIFRGRDGSTVTAVIYYATPWLLRLLAGLFAVAVLKHWGLRLMAATCVLVSAMEAWHSWKSDEVSLAVDRELQVSIYNTGRTLETDREAWFSLGNADLTAVVESGDFTDENWQAFTAATNGVNWLRFGGTMLGVKGKVLSQESLGVYDLYRCYRVRVQLPEHGEMTAVVVDIRSQPWLSREQAMAGVLKATRGDPSVVVLGDFNTPPGSKWYQDWHSSLSLANDGPHSGFRETWAYGLPLLTLDQVWIGSRWKAVWTDHTRHDSDHSRVRTVLVEKP